jgi:hypothetical protein
MRASFRQLTRKASRVTRHRQAAPQMFVAEMASSRDQPFDSENSRRRRVSASTTLLKTQSGLDRLRFHLIGDELCLPDRQGDDRQRRIFGAT